MNQNISSISQTNSLRRQNPKSPLKKDKSDLSFLDTYSELTKAKSEAEDCNVNELLVFYSNQQTSEKSEKVLDLLPTNCFFDDEIALALNPLLQEMHILETVSNILPLEISLPLTSQSTVSVKQSNYAPQVTDLQPLTFSNVDFNPRFIKLNSPVPIVNSEKLIINEIRQQTENVFNQQVNVIQPSTEIAPNLTINPITPQITDMPIALQKDVISTKFTALGEQTASSDFVLNSVLSNNTVEHVIPNNQNQYQYQYQNQNQPQINPDASLKSYDAQMISHFVEPQDIDAFEIVPQNKIDLTPASNLSLFSNPPINLDFSVPEVSMPSATSVYTQISTEIVTNYKNGNQIFKMELCPQELGKVIVKMSLESGILTLEIVAENPKTQSLFLSNSHEVKSILQALVREPVYLSEMSFQTPFHDQQRGHNGQAFEQPDRNEQNKNAYEPIDEVNADNPKSFTLAMLALQHSTPWYGTSRVLNYHNS